MLKISEVYEKQVKVIEERPDGSEYAAFSKALRSREILINTDYIVSVCPHELTSSSVVDMVVAAFPEGTKFCILTLDGNSFRKSEVMVVGSFEKFCRLLGDSEP